MPEQTRTQTLNSAEQTAGLARRLAPRLIAGDTILLSGPIGAGKSLFCRHLIQCLLDEPEDVPSPTFTLVQTYDTAHGEIWHSDLYRLTGPAEIDELGLFEAFDTAICLVEWPDRLGNDAPGDALSIELIPDAHQAERRDMRLNWSNPKWAERLKHIIND